MRQHVVARVFDIGMQLGTNRGAAELKIIADRLERPVIEKFPTHLGMDLRPPPLGLARKSG